MTILTTKNTLLKFLGLLIIGLSIQFTFITSVHAEERAAETGFSVKPILPATQFDKSKTFFMVETKPGEPQKIRLEIRSTKKDPVTTEIYIRDAYTTSEGLISYDGGNYKRDPSLKNSVKDITTISEKKVTVQNFETKVVEFTITPPKESYSGIKAASICVMNASDDKNDKNTGLGTKFGYQVGLVLSESDDTYDDGQNLNVLSVKPKVSQGKRVISTKFQNPDPKIIKYFSATTRLTKKGSKEVLRKRSADNMRIAPNSSFEFMTDWGVDPIKPGTYVLTIDTSAGGKKRTWKKEFTISSDKANQMNEEAAYTLTYPKWTPLVVLFLGILISVNIVFLFVRNKNQKK